MEIHGCSAEYCKCFDGCSSGSKMDYPPCAKNAMESGTNKIMSIRNDVIDECIAIVEKTVRKNCDDHTPYQGECQTCGRYDNPDVPDMVGILVKLQDLKERSPRQV